jgi:hypothetical protein
MRFYSVNEPTSEFFQLVSDLQVFEKEYTTECFGGCRELCKENVRCSELNVLLYVVAAQRKAGAL